MSVLYVLLGLLLLSFLVMMHELGHYLSARAVGIPVKAFSIGFGPKLIHWTGRSGTEFSIRPIPLGGFCMFYGDTDDDPDGKQKDDPRCYSNAPVWKRMISVISGPLMNILLSFLVAILLTSVWGKAVESVRPVLVEVEPSMPGIEAGLLPGDRFLSVNNTDVSESYAQGVVDAIGLQNDGAPITLRMMRDSSEYETTLTPVWDEDAQQYRIGVTISTEYTTRPLKAAEVLPQAWDTAWYYLRETVLSVGTILRGKANPDNFVGPVGIVSAVAQVSRAEGLYGFLTLMCIISISLGIMNLLPIPGLDGSRLIFQLIELIFRKPVPQKWEAVIHLAGYALLILFAVYVMFKDVLRLFR